MIAGTAPMPCPKRENTGIIRPNSAIEGSVRITVAAPSSGGASHSWRLIRMPSGTPARIAQPTAMPTR